MRNAKFILVEDVTVYKDHKNRFCDIEERFATGSLFNRRIGGEFHGLCDYAAMTGPGIKIWFIGQFQGFKPQGMVRIVHRGTLQYLPYKNGIQNGCGVTISEKIMTVDEWSRGKRLKRMTIPIKSITYLQVRRVKDEDLLTIKGFRVVEADPPLAPWPVVLHVYADQH